MGITFQNPIFYILIISISLSSIIYQATGNGMRLSTFTLYWHDIFTGRHPSAVNIIKPPINGTGFGMVNMIDNPLTSGPKMSSKLLGRAQGFYGMASQEEISLIMVMNFVFITGKYNGSTLTILGSNSVMHKVREMSVIGGTGLFRFAHGYALARTYSLGPSGNAIVKYHVHVMHY